MTLYSSYQNLEISRFKFIYATCTNNNWLLRTKKENHVDLISAHYQLLTVLLVRSENLSTKNKNKKHLYNEQLYGWISFTSSTQYFFSTTKFKKKKKKIHTILFLWLPLQLIHILLESRYFLYKPNFIYQWMKKLLSNVPIKMSLQQLGF